MNFTKIRFLTWTGLAGIVAITLWLALPRPDIWEAIEKGNEHDVRWLLTLGANPNSKDEYGAALLMAAVIQNHLPIVRLLVENGADVNAERGLDGDAGSLQIYRTALFDAVRHADGPMVRYLLEKGAHPNVQDSEGYTPLSYSAHSADREKVRLLLNYGAEVNTHNCTNANPLSIVGSVEIANLLIDHRADLEVRGADTGATPLIWQIFRGKSEIAELLIERGALINARDGNGRTPLMWAAQRGLEDTTRLLLKRGADIDARDRRDNSALSLSTEWHKPGMAALLKAAGAKPHTPKRPEAFRPSGNRSTGRRLAPAPGT